MSSRRLIATAIAAASLAAGLARADLDAELADLGERAAYGYYAREPAVVEAARVDLERLTVGDARVTYHRALAALRSAQLRIEQGRPGGAALGDCLRSSERSAAEDPEWSEPWVLVAACSAMLARVEPVRAFLHGRRFENAAARARGLDPQNPRLPLVMAWRAAQTPADLDAASAAAMTPALEAALDVFRARARAADEPEWGEAETLALLGALYLSRGDVRAARDVIEQALIAAPGYAQALELQRRLDVHLVGARTP